MPPCGDIKKEVFKGLYTSKFFLSFSAPFTPAAHPLLRHVLTLAQENAIRKGGRTFSHPRQKKEKKGQMRWGMGEEKN